MAWAAPGVPPGLVYAWTHFETFRRIVTDVATTVGAAATWLWEKVLRPAFTGLTFLVERILGPAVLWLWRNVFSPVFTGIQIVVKIAWAILQVIFGLLEIALKGIGVAARALGVAVTLVWNTVLKPVFSKLGDFIGTYVAPAFKRGVEAIGKAWESIREVAKAPVKFVVDTVLNNGILAAYNTIARFFKIKPDDVHITLPKGFAGGGPIIGPGTGTSDSVLARLSTGEHVWTASEVAAAGGHQAVLSLRSAVSSGTLPGFKDGGIVGAAKKAAQAAAHAAATVGRGALGAAEKGIELATDPVKWVIAKITGSLDQLNNAVFDSPFGRAVAAVPKAIAGFAVDAVKSRFGGGPDAQFVKIDKRTSAATPVADIAARTVQLLHRPASEVAGWARRIMFESGGSATAVNRWDSNWAAGHPSVGLAQLIAGTFARWAGPFRNIGPFLYGVSVDPLANSYAGGNYAVNRYGSLAAVDPLVRPEGYDQGGMLDPGWNLAYNGLDQPERVLTPGQWESLTRPGRQVNVKVDNHGRDLDGWDVVRAIREKEALIPAFNT
jgi:SLT domain-containing protein